MKDDTYRIRLQVLKPGPEGPRTLLNVRCNTKLWPSVHIALEILRNENSNFTYTATFNGRKAVG